MGIKGNSDAQKHGVTRETVSCKEEPQLSEYTLRLQLYGISVELVTVTVTMQTASRCLSSEIRSGLRYETAPKAPAPPSHTHSDTK
jgi:hypothetical protein